MAFSQSLPIAFQAERRPDRKVEAERIRVVPHSVKDL
jgi:hypothetical protein